MGETVSGGQVVAAMAVCMVPTIAFIVAMCRYVSNERRKEELRTGKKAAPLLHDLKAPFRRRQSAP